MNKTFDLGVYTSSKFNDFFNRENIINSWNDFPRTLEETLGCYVSNPNVINVVVASFMLTPPPYFGAIPLKVFFIRQRRK